MTRLRIVGLLAAALAVAAVALSVAVPAARAIPGGINGAGLKPSMGWSSWSFLRKAPTAAKMEAQADAMVSSGLAAVGYQYINLDDFYYTYPALNPRTVGMNVDAYGRWVTDPVAFPAGPNGEDGMKVLADYIHSKGLKFGIYLTPGIPKQAVV
jgi:alpha-galactosidase